MESNNVVLLNCRMIDFYRRGTDALTKATNRIQQGSSRLVQSDLVMDNQIGVAHLAISVVQQHIRPRVSALVSLHRDLKDGSAAAAHRLDCKTPVAFRH
jgi:hypothetical protein